MLSDLLRATHLNSSSNRTGAHVPKLTLDWNFFNSDKQASWSQVEGTCITEMICVIENANIQVCS